MLDELARHIDDEKDVRSQSVASRDTGNLVPVETMV